MRDLLSDDWPDDAEARDRRISFANSQLQRLNRGGMGQSAAPALDQRYEASLAKANALCRAIDDVAIAEGRDAMDVMHDLIHGRYVWSAGYEPED